MQELKANEKVNLTNGSQCTVIKELGRGGQGIVYLVEVNGQQMALKWYLKAPEHSFYKNLEENVASGAPSEAFLWPEYITMKEKGSYGYVMKLRPNGYYEFGQFMLARVQFKNVEAMVNAAMKICEGFMKLHLGGYSYQDLNDGNFFIDPHTGDVLICDNDNVMAQGEQSGILGKARYMAPEVVTGKNMPDKYSDRYSLAVILFLLFYGNHPLEGQRTLACACMTEKSEQEYYGTNAVFIYDDDITDNRPVRGVHTNVISLWPAFPSILRDAFKKEFSQDCLYNPSHRMIEAGWQKLIQRVRDMLAICPYCHEETFVEDQSNPTCVECKKTFSLNGSLRIGARNIVLTPGSRIYLNLDEKPDMLVVGHPGEKYPVQIKNISQTKWTVETQSGRVNPIDPGTEFPVRVGLKINFQGTVKGEIV